MKFKKLSPYVSLAIIQALLVVVAFPRFFLHPLDALFCDWGDGYKNYFTLCSYAVTPPGPDSIFKYPSFAYPFGDYVYYTDNTPLFSIPFRWWCHHISNISNLAIPAFNYFIIGNIWLSALLVYFIFSRFLGRNALTYVLALYLPWVNMQIPRIWEGDFNLACCTPILAVIAVVIGWFQYRRHALFWVMGMVVLLFLSFLGHGYYIAILAVFLGGMLFFLGAGQFRTQFGRLSMLAGIVAPAAGLATVLVLLRLTDPYLHLRPAGAGCYDCAVLKTNFLLLFTHYDFHTLAFPIATTRVADTESMVYLGNIGLFAFGGMWVGAVFSGAFRRRVFAVQAQFFADPLRRAVFLAGLLSLIVSFGERYGTNRDQLVLYTPFNTLNRMNPNILLILIAGAAVVIYGLVLLFSAKARAALIRIGGDYRQYPLRKLGLLAVIALMIYLFVGRYSAIFINVLNPFFYVHFLTREVEQFRSLSRFAWPFFWTFYIWIMYTLWQLYLQSGVRARVVLQVLFLFVAALEVSDYMFHLRKEAAHSNLLSAEHVARFSKLRLDYNRYQAILPIPFYTVGSEDFDHTIDDNNDWTIFTTQLSLSTGLPLMSCKLSRTPNLFNNAILGLVCGDTLQPALRQRLNRKPILIACNRTLLNDPAQATLCARGRESSQALYLQANDLIRRHHLSPVDSMGDVLFYSWVAE